MCCFEFTLSKNFVKKMTLRKITVDNGVKYTAQNEQTQLFSGERESKPNTIKNNSLPRKQIKKLSEIKKNSSKKIYQEKHSDYLNE